MLHNAHHHYDNHLAEAGPQECQLPLSEASQGWCWLCTAGVNYRPHGVKGVPLRLAGAGSTKLNYLLPSSKGVP
jgi:hypothetical protein